MSNLIILWKLTNDAFSHNTVIQFFYQEELFVGKTRWWVHKKNLLQQSTPHITHEVNTTSFTKFISERAYDTLSLFTLFSSLSTSRKRSFSLRRTFVKTLCTRRGPRSRRLFRPYPSRSCSDETSRSFFSPLFVYRLEVERNGFSIWFSRRWMERWVSKRRRRRMADRSTRLSLIAPDSVLAWCATFPCSCATAGRVLTTTL